MITRILQGDTYRSNNKLLYGIMDGGRVGFHMNQSLQRQLDMLVGSLTYRPTMLLHSCCAPCSSYVLEYLAPFFHITLFYYNPNIIPSEEYQRRLEEQKRLLREMPATASVKMVEGEYDTERFFHGIRGLEQEPEGGARCRECFRMRLEAAANKAGAIGFEFVGTTLSISPHKDAELVDTVLKESAVKANVKPLPADFKKKGGYQRSLVLSKDYGLYRQSFCGCPFSTGQYGPDKQQTKTPYDA